MTNNENEMRAQFQEWHSQQVTRLRDHGELGAAKKWEELKWICEAAWQASRQSLAVDLPSAQCIRINDYTAEETRESCRRAIESQGVKCK